MKRDMDLIRTMLLAIEMDDRYDAASLHALEGPSDFGVHDKSFEEVAYHLQMIVDRGLIYGKRSNIAPIYGGLTMAGHDFLDSVRDPEIWRQTKDAAGKAGGFTLDLLVDLAKGLVKTQLKRLTGIEL